MTTEHHETLTVLCDVINHYLTNLFIVAPRPGSDARHDPVMQRAMDHLTKCGATRVSDRTESPEPASGEDLEGERGPRNEGDAQTL